MKRCNACFRYALDDPRYCPNCGRSYDVRICVRGHLNPRTVQFCTECGSDDLSTPAPPEGLLGRLSRWVLVGAVYFFVAIVGISLVLGLLASLDLRDLTEPLLMLALMLAFLYWTTTLLPGPVKRIGRAAGRQVVKAVKGRQRRGR